MQNMGEDINTTEEEVSGTQEGMEERQLPPAKVEVSVKLSVIDMYYFMLRHTYTAFSGWFGIVISLAAFVLLICGVGRGDKRAVFALIFLSLLFTVINPLILFIKSWKQVKLSPMFQKPISYGFGDGGIEIRQGEERAAVYWDEVVKAVCKENLIIIYMSRIRAFILPVRQFEEECDKVMGIIRENVSQIS